MDLNMLLLGNLGVEWQQNATLSNRRGLGRPELPDWISQIAPNAPKNGVDVADIQKRGKFKRLLKRN